MLGNGGQDDGYLAIADYNGHYAWAASFGGSGRDYAVDAAAAPNGDFVVVGNFSSITMSVGGTSLSNSGETDAFVAKYNQDKTFAWVRKIGTAGIDEVLNVAVDAAGNTYVSGHVLDKFTHATLYIFVRKLDAAGNLVWERKGNNQGGTLLASALAIDGDQALYLGGSLYGTATFGSTDLSSSDTSNAAFIVKYSPSGTILDTLLYHNLDKFTGLQAQGNNLYACAEKVNWGIGWGWPLASSKIHVLKLDADLDSVWHKTAGGGSLYQSLDIAKSLSLDEEGNVYVTGYFFSDTLHFAGHAMLNPFNQEYFYPQIFVFKYAPHGGEIWGKSLGGIHSDEATGILAIGDDKFYLCGNFESNPAIFGAYSLHNAGTLDSIYVHLRPPRFGRKTMGFLAVFDKDVSGTNSEPAFEEVAIFPNPTAGFVTVQLKSHATLPFTFQLHADDGRLLRQTAYKSGVVELHEDLTGLPPGRYFVSLRTAQGLFAGAVVKHR
jgi:hypothetical protein